MKKISVVFGALALAAFIGLSFKIAGAFSGVVPSGPQANGQAITGMGSDGFVTRWTNYYGQPQVVNSNYMFENSTGVGVNTLVPTAQLAVNLASSGSTNLQNWTVANSTVAVVGPQGHVNYRTYTTTQVNTLVPDAIGALITVNNMGTIFFPGGFAVCQATGTLAAQWSVVGSTHGVNQNGCGTLQ